MSLSLRPAVAADAPLLERMLLAAATWRGNSDLTIEALRQDPPLWHYVEGWPRTGDFGFVIEDDHSRPAPIGAAWARVFSADQAGYGFVDEAIPEISVGVDEDHRGTGLGRRLVEALIAESRTRELAGLSLSVEQENAKALRLYQSLGFVVVGRVQNSPTMLLSFSADPLRVLRGQ